MVLEQDAVPPRMLNPKVDPDLEMIALKCLQKPQDLRYPSADALAADLEAYLANEPISARSTHLSRDHPLVLFRETHHAAILENWGLLWMWHSLAVFLLCLITNAMQWQGVSDRWPYLALWSSKCRALWRLSSGNCGGVQDRSHLSNAKSLTSGREVLFQACYCLDWNGCWSCLC